MQALRTLERVRSRSLFFIRLQSSVFSVRLNSSSVQVVHAQKFRMPLLRHCNNTFLQYECHLSLFAYSSKFYSSGTNSTGLDIEVSPNVRRRQNVEYRKLPLITGQHKLKRLGILGGLHMSTSESIAEAVKQPARGVQKDVTSLLPKRVMRRKKTATLLRDKEYFEVTAYASAEEYNLDSLKDAININSMYTLQQLPEDALDAIHMVSKNDPVTGGEPKEIFFFSEGTVVFWNVTKNEQQNMLELVKSHQNGSYDDVLLREEGVENIEFTYTENKTCLVGSEIHLHKPEEDEDLLNRQLEMFTFSNAIALSVKLAIWEASLSSYVDSVEWVLEDLKDGKKIRMSEAEVLKKAGELFTLSHLINLSSDLLDTPDFYWDRHSLEKLYHKTCNHLSLARRVKVMNEKLSQCFELTELLRDHLKDKHHTRLELMIIFLILIEVIFGIDHLVERHSGTRVV